MAVNWAALLNQDFLLPTALQAVQRQEEANQANLYGRSAQAVGQFGYAPDLSGVFGAGTAARILDQPLVPGGPTARQLAGQTTQGGVSTWAQLLHAGDVARANDLHSLAGRGMAHSGALGVHLAELQNQQNTGQYNAVQQLMGQLGGYQQDYLTQQASNQQQAASATNDALTRIINGIGAGLYGSGGAAPTAGGAAGAAAAASKFPNLPVNQGQSGTALYNTYSDHPLAGVLPRTRDPMGGALASPKIPRMAAPRPVVGKLPTQFTSQFIR